VVESATDNAIIEMNFAGRITGWSPGAERVLGWTAAEAIGQDGEIIWVPEGHAVGLPAEERRAADETGSVAAERWHLKRDGTRFWGAGHLTPLRNGRPHGYLRVLRDRTPERRAEEALRASEARFRALATAGTHMVYRMSADWQRMHQLDGRSILVDAPEVGADLAPRCHGREFALRPRGEPAPAAPLDAGGRRARPGHRRPLLGEGGACARRDRHARERGALPHLNWCARMEPPMPRARGTTLSRAARS
jgi:PAS domain S-box-containing protein